jgi:hypothetical protein
VRQDLLLIYFTKMSQIKIFGNADKAISANILANRNNQRNFAEGLVA